MVLWANWSAVDDHIIPHSLEIGNGIPFFIWNGRFYPLNGFEYYYVSLLAGASPYALYFFNAIQLITVLAVLAFLLRYVTGYISKLGMGLILFLGLSPGTITSFYRLFVTEKNIAFYSSL